MQFWPVKLIHPFALLCGSLLLILLLIPDSSLVLGGKGGGGGKKLIAPVKHLFGVGIGYQRVVHYKPVLVFSKHRRPKKKKKRRPGWGWGGGGGRGKSGWSPVIVQHHIYKDGGPHHRHGGGGHHHQQHREYSHHPKRRTKSHPLRRPHRHGGVQSYRGWGWRSTTGPARRNPEIKTHHGHHNDHHQHYHPHERQNGGGHHEYHSPPLPPPIHNSPTSDYDFGQGPGVEWSHGVGGDPGYSMYGSPGVDYADGDDANGYETGIKEHWNKHSERPLTPLVFPGSTVAKPTLSPQLQSPPSPLPQSPPPLYPFEDAPTSDTSVTNIRKDFLKTHMKNFRQFQGYQNAHRNNDEPVGNQMMKPPGVDYSTTDIQSSPGGASPDIQYYDSDYFTSNEATPSSPQGGKGNTPPHNNGPSDNYNYDVVDDDGFNWSELNRKMSAKAMASSAPTPAPLVAHGHSPGIIYGVQGALSSNQNNVVVNAPVQTNIQVGTSPNPNANVKDFKPSQRIDEMGSGDAFSDPGFFPTFDQFRKISME